MKAKILIISLLFCLNSFGQKLPITGLCWSDVFTATSTSCSPDAWTAANSSYFDATYAVSGDCLDDWRNYGPSDATAPTVTTTVISAITGTTATGGGSVTADGGASVTARGVCWNTSTNPTTANSYTSDGTGTGSFTSYLTSLTCGATYFVRAYATNSAGTAYGSNVSFTSSTTRPTGLTEYAFFNSTRLGSVWTDITIGNVCTQMLNNEGSGYEGESSGVGSAVYLSYTDTNCDKVPDGYYLVSRFFTLLYRIQIVDGIWYDAACPE